MRCHVYNCVCMLQGTCPALHVLAFATTEAEPLPVCRYASTFQMLRGTMVMWCGLLTICVLRRNLHIHHWVGICMIAAGSVLVIASSVFDSDPTQTNGPKGVMEDKASDVAQFPLFGAALVILGQLVSALQVPPVDSCAVLFTITSLCPRF